MQSRWKVMGFQPYDLEKIGVGGNTWLRVQLKTTEVWRTSWDAVIKPPLTSNDRTPTHLKQSLRCCNRELRLISAEGVALSSSLGALPES